MATATLDRPTLLGRDRILQLPPSVVNKIAAGEVIERPASVVKELLENSLDAGATRIDVGVAGGGSDLVRVTDNGCGIAAEDLPLAVASHATSKIGTADDLFHVGTLGFRGEALASMAEVSRLEITSRAAGADAGARLEVVGGQAGEVEPTVAPVGTTIEVRQLFYNTPVRRKFLKAVQTEIGHVSEAFTRLALAWPDRHFTLKHNDRTLYDLPAGTSWRDRIAAFFGPELADALIAIESREGDVHLRGYAAHPSHSRSHPRMQYLFLNGRHIRDRALQHALAEAYRGLLLTGRFPIAFLRIDLPSDAVDVNVHPTKLEVRFQDGGRLYSQLLGTLRTKFLATDLNARIKTDAAAPAAPAEGPAAAHDADQADRLRQELISWAQGQADRWAGAARPPSQVAELYEPSHEDSPAPRRPLELNVLPEAWPADPRREPARAPAMPAAAAHHVSALQIHNRYLVAETEEGLTVIDQHALHERILYEQLREKVLSAKLESQALLTPEPVDLAPAEAAAVRQHAGVLAQLGMEVQPFGGDTFLISSYPAMLANLPPRDVLRSIVDLLQTEGRLPQARDLLDEMLHMIACKAAIKAGDRLSPAEIAALLDQRHLVQDAHHCPHGRPTALVFTREDLDRQFKRT